MSVNPVPTVTITQADGTPLSFTPASPDAVIGGQLVHALDDLTASWGRSSFTDHHEAQTAKFSVLWPNGFGRFTTTGSGTTNPGGAWWDAWKGCQVVMSWTDPASGTVRIFFRGTITDVRLRPRDPDNDVPPGRAPRPRGAFVDLVAIGTLAGLANIFTATETWPEESGTARINRLVALAGPLVAGVDYRAFWAAKTMSGRSVDGTSVLSLLEAMYDTAGGDRLAYDPHTNRVGYVRRRAIPAAADGSNYLARLRRDDTLYPGGVHVQPHNGGALSWPMLDARWMEGGRTWEHTVDNEITHVVCRWNESNGTVARSSLVVTVGETYVRTMDLQTELATAGDADTARNDWYSIMIEEGRNPVPEPMTYRADLAGGFDSLAAAQLLIGGAELQDPGTGAGAVQGGAALVFLAGSLHQALRVHAVYGFMGGSIRYVKGGWRATVNPVRVFWEGTTYAPPVKCGQLKANATNDTFRTREFAHSITWNDLRTPASW